MIERPEWLDRLQVGDVMRKGRRFRVVREVHRFSTQRQRGKQVNRIGLVSSVTFSILRCSWTKRPYTSLNYHDLLYQGWQPAGFRVKLQSELDKELADNIANDNRRTLFCCDVVGVLS